MKHLLILLLCMSLSNAVSIEADSENAFDELDLETLIDAEAKQESATTRPAAIIEEPISAVKTEKIEEVSVIKEKQEKSSSFLLLGAAYSLNTGKSVVAKIDDENVKPITTALLSARAGLILGDMDLFYQFDLANIANSDLTMQMHEVYLKQRIINLGTSSFRLAGFGSIAGGYGVISNRPTAYTGTNGQIGGGIQLIMNNQYSLDLGYMKSYTFWNMEAGKVNFLDENRIYASFELRI